MSGESKQELAIKEKMAKVGTLEAAVLPFLSPEVCQDASKRVLFPNAMVKPACPTYQKGIIESNTLDIGDHQVRNILLLPHVSAPVLLSHQSLAAQAGVLFQATGVRGGRLCSETTGTYGGNQSPMPWFRSHEVASLWNLATGASVALPIHGCAYTAYDSNGASALKTASQLMIRDWTEVLNGGVGTGVRAIPCMAGDIIAAHGELRATTAWVAGDLYLDVVTCDALGALTTTSAQIGFTVGVQYSAWASLNVTIPALAVGIVSVSIRNANAATRTYDLCTIKVSHRAVAVQDAATVAATGAGSYVGSALSGLQSMLPTCSAGRVTALSVKVTNTASELNANGYIVAVATADSLPGNVGCFGENTIAGLTTSKSYKFRDGSYMAIAPSLSLDYAALDALPGPKMNYGLFVIQSQDNTPITFKVEYHAVVEVISQDPLFAPITAYMDAAVLQALQKCQESAGYLILSENPFHWGAIGKAIGGAARFVNKTGLLKKAAGLGIPGMSALDKVSRAIPLVAAGMAGSTRPKVARTRAPATQSNFIGPRLRDGSTQRRPRLQGRVVQGPFMQDGNFQRRRRRRNGGGSAQGFRGYRMYRRPIGPSLSGYGFSDAY